MLFDMLQTLSQADEMLMSKTQLVTKYVYERKARKPWASIFWVSARSDEEIDFGTQETADKLALTQDLKGRVQ